MLVSALAMGLSVYWLTRRLAVGRWWLVYAATSLYLLFSGAYGVAHRLTGKGIDISVAYHLQTGLEGTGWLDFAPVLAVAALGLVLSLVLPAWLIRRLPAPSWQTRHKRHTRPWVGSLPLWLSLLVLVSAWAAHPGVHDVRKLGLAFFSPALASEDLYFTPPLVPKSVQARGPARDLVWIYLESLERGYMNAQRFAGLTPHLTALEQQSLSFTNLRQVDGTGWTIAGMVASQCGVPLLSLADGNALTGADSFMTNATCLGDVLQAQGHQLHYVGGASLVFAGKGAFYRTHGFEPQGIEEILPQLPANTPTTDWGLYDDTLYAHAWRELLQLAEQDAPLAMLMLTLDTHHPIGHPSPSCQHLRYGDASNPMLNAVHCADALLGRFVAQLQQHPRLKDALIVISSDHLAMPNTATNLLDQDIRRNLVLMLNTHKPAQQIDRLSTSLDIAPTVLQQMGLQVPAMGYGRDLLGSASTLAEMLHYKTNTFLLSRLPVLRQLWRHPDLSQGLHWQTDRVVVDDRRLPLPALFQLDDQERVSSVAYPGGRWLAELVLEMPAAHNMVWVDRCNWVQGIAGQATPAGQALCVAVGQAGHAWHIAPVEPDQVLSFSSISQSLAQSRTQTLAPGGQAARLGRLHHWLQWGSWQIDQVLRVQGLQKPLVLRSSGHPAATSVANAQASQDFLLRGITALRIAPDGQAQKMGHIDTCAQQASDAVSQTEVGPFDKLSRFRPTKGGDVVVVMAHDSAVCGPSTLPNLARGTPFQEAARLGFRQPYIGVWLPDGSVHEYTGTQGQTLTLGLKPEAAPAPR